MTKKNLFHVSILIGLLFVLACSNCKDDDQSAACPLGQRYNQYLEQCECEYFGWSEEYGLCISDGAKDGTKWIGSFDCFIKDSFLFQGVNGDEAYFRYKSSMELILISPALYQNNTISMIEYMDRYTEYSDRGIIPAIHLDAPVQPFQDIKGTLVWYDYGVPFDSCAFVAKVIE